MLKSALVNANTVSETQFKGAVEFATSDALVTSEGKGHGHA